MRNSEINGSMMQCMDYEIYSQKMRIQIPALPLTRYVSLKYSGSQFLNYKMGIINSAANQLTSFYNIWYDTIWKKKSEPVTQQEKYCQTAYVLQL